ALKAKVLPFLWGVLGLFVAVESVVLPVVVSLFNNPDLKSIHAVRGMKQLEGVPFYHDCGEELRIEIVYEAGRKILPYCFQDEEELPALPFVLVSEKAPEQLLSPQQLSHLNVEIIGIYDDNKRPANTSWHSSSFVHYVTWIREKQE
ncbi:MAG: phospholipid carrier-dependent glycosyltransferase, partial [Odoribacter sp.]|nr:phospholipid carrier-dependent glycosyltransferase [Odoribacter sp.]